MYAKVKRLRQRGVRLSNHDLANVTPTEGDVVLFGIDASYVVALRDPNNQVRDSLLPQLYDARLVTMHGDKMLFRGEERPQGEDRPAFVQEWTVLVETR